jgi:hypothetical protein
MGNCFSKDPGHPLEEPVSTTPAVTDTKGKSDSKEKSANGTKKLLSDRQDMDLKEETVDPEKAAAMLEMGIQVIDLFQKAADATKIVLPSPLGDVLEKVTSVLKVLKVSSFDSYCICSETPLENGRE